jgi:hypothetical protein
VFARSIMFRCVQRRFAIPSETLFLLPVMRKLTPSFSRILHPRITFGVIGRGSETEFIFATSVFEQRRLGCKQGRTQNSDDETVA